MSIRILNLIVYLALAGAALVVHMQVSGLEPVIPGDTGSGFFPSVLAWIIIGLSAIGLVKTLIEGEDGRFEIENAVRIFVTVVVIAIWVLAWSYLGNFYLLEFLMLFVLFTYYRMDLGITQRRLLEHVALAAAVTAVCWVVFNQLIYIDL